MLRLFYFSGTGNARNVAHWLSSAWQAHGRSVALVDLARVNPNDICLDAEDEFGLVSPTHGFNFPPITLRFLCRLPRARNANRAFVVNTRGGVRLFGKCLPGLSGVTQLLVAIVFLLKGYRVVGMRPIDLPSNWISLHPGLREENVRAIYERCAAITQRFADRILEGRRDLRALWDLPQDILIAPISLGYYLVGRFFLAKSFVATSACDGCGACVKQCPLEALRLVDERPFWTWRCESCMRCMNHCPRRAVETAHGFVVAVPVVVSIVMTWIAVPALRPLLPAWATAGGGAELAHYAFDNVLALAVLFAAYRLLHRALRWRLVNHLVVATSLTHFAFWRRYRAPRLPATASPSEPRPQASALYGGCGEATPARSPTPQDKESGSC
jgi:Pyruvate/2-oxoacid:ferredoxin oxidoreductase delta subunit